MVLDSSSIWIYNYTGRLHLSPRYQGSQAQIPLLTTKCISLGLDVLAIRDYADTAGKVHGSQHNEAKFIKLASLQLFTRLI